jgi:glycosyltransferase involved in cell wall biosynthesis
VRIALVVPELPPDSIGGGGIVFDGLARTLHDRGHDVRVLTSATAGAPADSEHPFPVLRVPQFAHFTSQYRTYMPPYPQALPAAKRFIKGCDVYHLHGYGVPFIDVALHFLVEPRRTVFTSHGFPYTAPRRGGALTAAYRMYDALFGSAILKRSARLTAVSSFAAEQVRRAAHRAVEIIPNALTELVPSRTVPPAIEAELIAPYVLCAGRVEPLKGFETPIRAIAKLADRFPALRLLIAGSDNGYRSTLQTLAASLGIESRVVFLGPVERPVLAHLYRRSGCFVVSSFTESFSMVTLEAMSQGAPCVLSATGGMLDLGQEGVDALFFPPGESGRLAMAIERIVTAKELARELSRNAIVTSKRYEWPEVARRYEAEYAALA